MDLTKSVKEIIDKAEMSAQQIKLETKRKQQNGLRKSMIMLKESMVSFFKPGSDNDIFLEPEDSEELNDL